MGNLDLFESIISTEEGFEDLISARDRHLNTSLHYIALFDQEDFIEKLIELLEDSSEKKLEQMKDLSE